MTKRKRPHGTGSIKEDKKTGKTRIRYRVNGARHSETFAGTRKEAEARLRDLLNSADTGQFITPDKITVGAWIDQWIAAGAPGRKKKKVGQRTLERYEELLRVHVKPKLGARPLQQLKATEIDRLYSELETKIAPMTLHHVHVTFNSCLSTAERKGLLRSNPMNRIENAPGSPE